jgi:hypothetical protein
MKTPGCVYVTGRFLWVDHLPAGVSVGGKARYRHGSPAKAGFVLDNADSSALMLPEFAAHTPSLVLVLSE